ncbi:MAG: hypothetical protein AB7V07_01855 [Candidatus Delongbacteria bacterium]
MGIFEDLLNLYSEIDNQYSRKEFDARRKRRTRQERKYSKQRELNDHAYFLFLFTRFEDLVRDKSSKVIKDEQKKKNWKSKRAWATFPNDKESDRISFITRASLLIDSSSHHFKKIKEYHKQRCTIAHGGNFSSPVSIHSVVCDFESLIRIMKS